MSDTIRQWVHAHAQTSMETCTLTEVTPVETYTLTPVGIYIHTNTSETYTLTPNSCRIAMCHGCSKLINDALLLNPNNNEIAIYAF